MANIRFIAENLVDSSVSISAVPAEDTNNKVENVKKIPRSKVFRSISDLTQDINLELKPSKLAFNEDFSLGLNDTHEQYATLTHDAVNNTATFVPTGVDSKLFIANSKTTPGNLLFSGAEYFRVRMRIRLVSGTPLWEGACRYKALGLPTYTAERSIWIPDPGLVAGVWQTIEWIWSDHATWSEHTITGLRFDLTHQATGSYEIDWIEIDDNANSVSAMVLGRHNFSADVTYRLELFSDNNWITPLPGYTPVTYTVSPEEAATDLWEWGEFNWGTVHWGGDKLNTNKQFFNIVLWLDKVYTGVRSAKIILAPVLNAGTLFFCDDYSIFCDNSSIYCDDLGYGAGGSGASNLPYYEIGRIFLGKYIEPKYNISYGHSIQWKENTQQYRPSSGTLHSDIVTANKEMSFDLNTIPEVERNTIHKQLINLGLSKDFFISLFPEDTKNTKRIDYSAIVKFTKVPKYTEFHCDYYKSNYIVEEV